LNVTGEQLRAARAMARMEQSDLAKRANVSVDTIKRLEKTIGPVSANVQTVDSVRAVLEAAGVEFTNGDQPGVKTRRKFQQGDYVTAAQFGIPTISNVGRDGTGGKILTTIKVPTPKRGKK
jgi:transcriptional regulator with XRE-family HTH domain